LSHCMVPEVGIEPTRVAPLDFEICVFPGYIGLTMRNA